MRITRAMCFAVLVATPACLLLTACDSNSRPHATTTANAPGQSSGEIVTASATDRTGRILEMRFDNGSNTATLLLDGQTIELNGQKPASGIWYKNSQYELRGKGASIVLHKDNAVVFESNEAAVAGGEQTQ